MFDGQNDTLIKIWTIIDVMVRIIDVIVKVILNGHTIFV